MAPVGRSSRSAERPSNGELPRQRADAPPASDGIMRNTCERRLFVRYGRLAAMEVEMSRMWRRIRIVVATALAFAVGSIPACGTMGGGGGMRYFSEPPSEALNYVATERAVT